MTDDSTHNWFAQLSKQTRRRLLKSIGVGAISSGFMNTQAAATPTGSDDSIDYDEQMYPGRRDLGYNIALTNTTGGERTATVRIRRQTPGDTNPVIYEQSYDIPAPVDGDAFPNVIRDSDPVSLGVPGHFRVSVETDRGRTADTTFYQPTGRVEANESISIRVTDDEIRLNFYRA
jgi:hypothetical protein